MSRLCVVKQANSIGRSYKFTFNKMNTFCLGITTVKKPKLPFLTPQKLQKSRPQNDKQQIIEIDLDNEKKCPSMNGVSVIKLTTGYISDTDKLHAHSLQNRINKQRVIIGGSDLLRCHNNTQNKRKSYDISSSSKKDTFNTNNITTDHSDDDDHDGDDSLKDTPPKSSMNFSCFKTRLLRTPSNSSSNGQDRRSECTDKNSSNKSGEARKLSNNNSISNSNDLSNINKNRNNNININSKNSHDNDNGNDNDNNNYITSGTWICPSCTLENETDFLM